MIINPPTLSQADFETALASANPGDIIQLPSGSATWGNSGHPNSGASFILVSNISIQGTGDSTVITLDDSGPQFATAVVNIEASGVTFSSIKVIASSVNPVSSFAVTPNGSFSTGFRISDITYQGGTAGDGYFAYIDVQSGLIDNCRFTAPSGSDELIFGRGPTNAWQNPNTLGTSSNVFIEDCTFNGAAYLCDANANSSFVVRFNTINGEQKADGHGFASNTPPRSFRNIEVYDNTWNDNPGGTYAAIEVRGAASRSFNNTSTITGGGAAWIFLTDYGYQAQWANYGNVYQTPTNYPLADQVGTGEDPQTAHEEPAYVWSNKQNGSAWPRTLHTVATGAIALYAVQTSNPSATFTESDIIQSNRDFFSDAGFDTNTGVSVGTTAQMNALTPGIAGYGFWVTDQGSWNTRLTSGTSGLLYVWSGTAWVLNYTPYTYPHPLRTKTATPIATPGGGSYGTPPTVTLSDTDSGARIYYTTDGSDPVVPSAAGPGFHLGLTGRRIGTSF